MSLVLVPLDADADAAGLARDLAPAFGGDEAPARALLEQTFALLTRDPRPRPWGCYLAEIDGQAVGTCAFKSAPTAAGEVELAYMTFPAYEGRGHATAMAGALARIADAGGAMPIAHTLPRGECLQQGAAAQRLRLCRRGRRSRGRAGLALAKAARLVILHADLYWSFRSPYSYLAIDRYRAMTEAYDLEIALKPVYPLAIRQPDFFEKNHPNWLGYTLRDVARLSQYLSIPIARPRPDPIVQDMATRRIAADQPYIYRLVRLGQAAARRGGASLSARRRRG